LEEDRITGWSSAIPSFARKRDKTDLKSDIVSKSDRKFKGGDNEMPTIVHFEIPADDVQRARKFYSDLFGWEIKGVPEMDYWFVTTSGEHHIDGGMMKRQHPQQPITNYIDVPDIDEYMKKVEQLGGRVVVSKMPVPTMGWFAQCLDTENNVFALWQSDKNAK
jgi:predicted enzyme related to lactoylglutathione lyase